MPRVVAALVRLDADDLAALDDQAAHLDAQADVGPLAAGGLGEGRDDLHRFDVARLRLERGDLVLGQAGVRVDVGQLLGGHRADIDAKLALHAARLASRPARSRSLTTRTMPVCVKTGGPPTRSSKCSKTRRLFWAMQRGQAVGVVLANDRPGLAAGAGAEERFFQQHDAAGAPLREVPGDAGAHDAAADDEDVAVDCHFVWSVVRGPWSVVKDRRHPRAGL